MIVYKIVNKINGKIYIGQTIRKLSERWVQHNSVSNGCRALYGAIKKYGKENFEISVIAKCLSIEEMNHREQLCIKLFNTMSPKGYNLLSGGKNKKDSKETLIKKTEANQRNAKNPEILKKRKESRLIFHKKNPDFAKRQSLFLKSRFLKNPELLDLASKLKGGKPFKVFKKQTMELVWQGINQAQCQRELGVSQSNISNCLKLKKKTCNGYIFRYVGEESVQYPAKTNGRKAIKNIETQEVFSCAQEAGNRYNLWPRNIRRAATKGLTAGKFHWSFV